MGEVRVHDQIHGCQGGFFYRLAISQHLIHHHKKFRHTHRIALSLSNHLTHRTAMVKIKEMRKMSQIKHPGDLESESESESDTGSSSSEDSDSSSENEQKEVGEATATATTASTTKKRPREEASPIPTPNPDLEPRPQPQQSQSQSIITTKSFASLGVVESLCEACTKLNWTTASSIQAVAIPAALSGRDVIGLAETGSGKTGAFAIPVLQALLATPQKIFCCVLAPTRELAFQIHEVFQGLGGAVGVSSVCITGGVDMMSQAIALARQPHIIVATPGRLVDHLENTKGFSMRSLKYLVMDEADRMLSMDFEAEVSERSGGGGVVEDEHASQQAACKTSNVPFL